MKKAANASRKQNNRTLPGTVVDLLPIIAEQQEQEQELLSAIVDGRKPKKVSKTAKAVAKEDNSLAALDKRRITLTL